MKWSEALFLLVLLVIGCLLAIAYMAAAGSMSKDYREQISYRDLQLYEYMYPADIEVSITQYPEFDYRVAQ